MRKTLLLSAALAAALLPWAAQAQGRPNTLQMSCAASADLVRRSGAIVLGTGPNIYDRYVSSKAYCERDEEDIPQWLATTDVRQCFIGYTCERRTGNPSPP
ncbi:MAG: hypothetical protein JWL62_282 [Hyphomicrobiales bacterium]|nr:hypothetical protein [Hyphomicrobiales bacterium]